MELVFLWIEKYKNIHKQGFNFSPRFECKFYDKYDEKGNLEDNCKLEIKSKEYIENFFAKNINVTAIVGKNGSGKSNILEILFYKAKYRYKNKIILFIISFKNKYYLYFFKGGELVLQKEINIDSNINIKLINKNRNEKFITEYDYISIFFSNLHKEMLYNFHTGNSFIDISTSYLIKEKSKQFFSITNALKMLNNADVNLPINMPKYLIINLKIGCSKQNDNIIIQKIRKLEHKLDYTNNNYFNYIFILELICLYSKNLGITDEDIDKLNNPSQLYELFIKNKSPDGESFCAKNLYEIVDIIKPLTIESDLTIKLSIKSDIEIINKIIDTIDLLKHFDVFTLHFDTNMSTGEESFLFQFANIYNSLTTLDKQMFDNKYSRDDIKILIDEGETTFHPQWQKKYLSYLIYFLSNNFPEKNFHLLLTSHSPFLLSDIPKENIIFLDKDEKGNCKVVNGLKEKKQTFGANIHTLLSDSFFMEDGLMGEFAKGKINEIKEFYQKVEKEKNTDENLEYYNQNKDKFWQIQKIIGEPFLQRVIKNYLDELELLFSDDETLIDKELAEIEERRIYLEALKNAPN